MAALGGALLVSCGRDPAPEFGRGLDVPYVQTPMAAVEAMMDMAQVTPSDTLIDLGCGDGRIVIAAAKRGARAVGYDLDPDRIAEARANSFKAGVTPLVSFARQDFFKADISQATVVTMFMIPNVIDRIRLRLESELAPATRVVSHSFPVKDWPLAQKAGVAGRTLYLYRVPPRAPIRAR